MFWKIYGGENSIPMSCLLSAPTIQQPSGHCPPARRNSPPCSTMIKSQCSTYRCHLKRLENPEMHKGKATFQSLIRLKCSFKLGTADRIRTCDLQSRSYQTFFEKSLIWCGFKPFSPFSGIFTAKTRNPLRRKVCGFFGFSRKQ